MTTELFIEGQQADINQDLASLLTMAIDDLKNFGSRQTYWSKSIVMPGTAKNNKLFGNIFEVSVSNPYNPDAINVDINFNPMVSARCLLFQDAIQAFKGTIRLTDIVIDKGVIDYEVALTGELYALNISLSSHLLENLDFSAYNHTYTAANISGSWDNVPGSGYYYPLIDYGLYSTDKHSWDIHTFRPALYVKEYIDKMLSIAGFTYDAPLFNTDRFKRLIIPHNQKQLTTTESYNLDVGITSNFHFTEADGTSKAIPFALHTVEQDYTNNTDSTLFTYTGADFSGAWELQVVGQWKKNSSIPFHIQVLKNGVAIASLTFESSSSTSYISFVVATTGNVALTNGDTLQVVCTQSVASSFDLMAVNGPTFFKVRTPGGTAVVTQPGDTVKINESAIPKNIKQIDFLTSIIKLFNLYIWEDKDLPNLLHIKPFVDFYSTSSINSIEWSYKLDRSQPIRITPLSELNAKTYLFTYASDTDYYNDLYNKRYNTVYGSHSFDTDYEFTQQIEKVDLIFASTPLIGYAGEEKVYPTIFKLNGSTEDRTDSKIRIMQSKKITGVTGWDIKNGATVLATVTSYGYAGHFDSPDVITNDLNFGATEELFFVAVSGNLIANQFNIYWSSYMAEITDKDSKRLTAKFSLKPVDILNLDFSKYIYIDGSIYRLYKITDYNLTVADTCEVQLLKVINTVY